MSIDGTFSGDATGDDDDDDLDFDVQTDNTPFIGVASQDKQKSVVAYYGIERHSSWIFTPLFRGGNGGNFVPPNTNINRSRGVTIIQ